MTVRSMTTIAALVLPMLAAAQEAPTSKPAKAEKPVCRREQQTGSIMPGKKTCHSHAEWAAIDASNAADAESALTRRPNRLPGRQ